MVLIQHLFGIASLRQTYREILVNVAYDEVTKKFNEVKFVTMDAGYKTPWIAKKTIERVFADAKERHAMRYTHHRGLAAVTRWGRLKFAAMNLKKLAVWSWKNSIFAFIFTYFCPNYEKNPAFTT